ncbi:helix-turn-helix domain-containing protein [Aquibacillus rhizosphaerae]|uniref:Helix-turn-helix transcriptional regulator n=1 Tax=Aquibacillus rhizosphaerae TaxID=3051431 RepID=A0ABT7L397_9BACI|nr:helix-turn-helix transcriptional regulator [Aquibacillus sp. LR5S19]MDL4840338.1 helix-turn-helix transcriptional regulator [Aquibacillus sp. LR5S19]
MELRKLNFQKLDISMLVSEERKKKSLTFKDIGLGIGTSPSYIFRIEKGKKIPQMIL